MPTGSTPIKQRLPAGRALDGLVACFRRAGRQRQPDFETDNKVLESVSAVNEELAGLEPQGL